MPWIVGTYLLHAFFSLFQASALQARKTQFIWFVSLTAFSANIGLNLALIPQWGMYGAAWATLAAYAIEALLMFAFAQRMFRIPFPQFRVAVAIATFFCILFITQLDFGRAGLRIAVFACALAGLLGLIWLLGGSAVAALVQRVARRQNGASEL